MDESELQERLAGVVLQLWDEGCPVAGPSHSVELANVALRRWRSFARRSKLRSPSPDERREDLARGLRDRLEADRKLVGPLMEDYRYLARALAAVLEEDERPERE